MRVILGALEAGEQHSLHPGRVLVAVGDEDVVEAAQVLLVHGTVLAPLLHQPEGDEEPPAVGGHNEEQEHRPHGGQADDQTLQ